MRLKNICIKEILQEAARFGNKERAAILKQINKFRFGVEYEFNVDEGVPFLDKLVKIDSPLESPMIRELSPHLVKITKAFEHLQNLGGSDALKAFATDMQDYIVGSTTDEEVEYFEENVLPDIGAFCKWFIQGVYAPSNEVRKIYKGDVLNEMGVLGRNTIRSSELSTISELAHMSNGGARITTQIALKARTAAFSIARYLDNDCDMLPTVITPQKHHTGMLNMLHSEVVEFTAANPSKVDVVKNRLNIPKSMIQSIVPDISVPNGVEVITKPIPFADTLDVMEQIFSFIQQHGNTDTSTGLHVNISVGGDIDLSNINFVKMLVLLDVDFFQGLSRGSLKYLKYPVRSDWVTPMYQYLSEDNGAKLLRLAEIYAYNRPDTFVRSFEESVKSDNEKKRAVNLSHLLNADVEQRRVEFRFLGGANYETRFTEIKNDILQFCYMMAAGASPVFLQREYLEGIIRILDRVVRNTPVNGVKYSSFSSLINAVRKNQ